MAKTRERKKADRGVAVVESYQRVFNGPEGQAVLYDMMNTHWVLRSTAIGAKNQFEQAFREGERNAVLRIMTILKVNPQQLRERIEEHDHSVV